MSKIYRVDELAKEWDISDRTIRRWIESDKLDAIRIGKVYRIKREAKEEFETKKPTKKD